jgi:proteasome lid subunit RPN8/RPN11
LSLILTPELERSIRDHAERDYPNECCGALVGIIVGAANHVSFVFPLNNKHKDSATRRFRILPGDLLVVEKFARSRSLNVVGFYHSHPDVPAVPSAYDKQHAWEAYSYLIAEVAAGACKSLRSWKLDFDADTFEEEKLLVNQCILEGAAQNSCVGDAE